MMHPQLVAGARVGFNDTLTMGSWGQGARSALPIVGEVFQQALRNRWLDQQAEFEIPRAKPRAPGETGDAEAKWPKAEEVFDGIMKELRRIFRY
jgi:penicillin-binding protein 1A